MFLADTERGGARGGVGVGGGGGGDTGMTASSGKHTKQATQPMLMPWLIKLQGILGCYAMHDNTLTAKH